jgi:serine/threonine protein phosphatase PrpC
VAVALLPRFDFRVDFASVTDVGRVRKTNEDVHRIVPELALFVVADGMGGHAAGEVASRIAVDAVVAKIGARAASKVLDRFLKDTGLEQRHAVFALLREAFQAANQAVRDEVEKNGDLAGMGTTLDVALLVRDRAFVAHTGDSRVYLARATTMIQLTHDQTLYESLMAAGTVRPSKATMRGHRNPLVSAVGLRPVVTVDTCFVEVTRGDRLLLCTDGVHADVESEAVLAQLLRNGSAMEAAQALVAHSMRKGGRDNATAMVVEVCDRFVARSSPDEEPSSGPVSSDMVIAMRSALLDGLPMASVLAALAAAVEVEIAAGETVPRLVASDCVSYIIVSGEIDLGEGRVLGPSGLLFAESLVGVTHEGPLPRVTKDARVMRLRADDFAEVCARDVALSAELHRRIARHLARRPERAPA